jgi:hypothetical protein
VKQLIRSLLVSEERSQPADAPAQWQPFLVGDQAALSLTEWEVNGGPVFTERETVAFALSQVTAAQMLPPLLALPNGVDLLNYRVELRDRLDAILVRELSLALEASWKRLGWENTGHQTYLCVIGAGVTACIDTVPGAERLYLRYASPLANELFHAGRTLDLPRSRLFLQTALYEKINDLLALVRDRCWQWF